jgi:hypothetical protein
MVITHFYAQKIIEVYNQQSSIKPHAYAGKAKDFVPRDMITISTEGKRQLAAAKGNQEAVNSLTKN